MTQYVLDAVQAQELRDALNRFLEGTRADGDRFDLPLFLAGQAAVEAPQASVHEWLYSPALALQYTRTHARHLSEPPQHVRCQYVKDGLRCRKGEGHERMPGDSGHEETKA